MQYFLLILSFSIFKFLIKNSFRRILSRINISWALTHSSVKQLTSENSFGICYYLLICYAPGSMKQSSLSQEEVFEVDDMYT